MTIVRPSGDTAAAIEVPSVMARRVSEPDGWMATMVLESTVANINAGESLDIAVAPQIVAARIEVLLGGHYRKSCEVRPVRRHFALRRS